MLYYLLYSLHQYISALNVTRYITFRTAAATFTALFISLVLGPWLIRKLREFQIGQVIRHEGPASHRPKAGTPTMGGLLILAAALVPTLLWADLTNVYIWIAMLSTLLFGVVGFIDDYLKITRRSHHGLRPRYKLGGQILVALAVGIALIVLARYELYSTRLIFPFFKNMIPDLGLLYVPFAVLVLGRRVERRQPDRRPRRPGDQRVRGRRPRRSPRSPTSPAIAVRRVSAARPLLAGGRAHGVLRRAGRREPGLSLVQLVPGGDFHGRRRVARARRRARHRRHPDQAGTVAAARRRHLRARSAVRHHPGRRRSR